jgi:hypothetical protein
MYLTVDINGAKNPNRLGRDGFSFYIDTNKNQVLPVGFGLSLKKIQSGDNYSHACISDSNWQYYRGGSCAALIMYNNWKIPDDYPW